LTVARIGLLLLLRRVGVGRPVAFDLCLLPPRRLVLCPALRARTLGLLAPDRLLMGRLARPLDFPALVCLVLAHLELMSS